MCSIKTKIRRQEFLFILPLLNRKNIDRSSALYSVKAPFELVHAHMTDICFFLRLQLIQNIAYF